MKCNRDVKSPSERVQESWHGRTWTASNHHHAKNDKTPR